MNTDYNKQAQDFLTTTSTKIDVVKSKNQSSPLWAEKDNHGYKYDITLTNPKGKYTFEYWGSINDKKIIDAINDYQQYSMLQNSNHYQILDILKKNGISTNLLKDKQSKSKEIEKLNPTAYDVLACLNVIEGGSFEDFCGDFGYDTDSIKAQKTYIQCTEQDRNIRILFTHDEIKKLSEIN